MVRLRVFIIGTVMQLFLGYPNKRYNASVANILKSCKFKKNSEIPMISFVGHYDLHSLIYGLTMFLNFFVYTNFSKFHM